MKKLNKLFRVLVVPEFIKALFAGTVAGVEHLSVLRNLPVGSVVDIGANKGQFSLVATLLFPDVKIHAFEPQVKPYRKFKNLFAKNRNVHVYNCAIGPTDSLAVMHVSKRDDSSSLLPISSKQVSIFPGTQEISTEEVSVVTLDSVIGDIQLEEPAILKIDVQGYELPVLKGCRSMLQGFEYVYTECSFVELYKGQSLAHEVINYLHDTGFALTGIFNVAYSKDGVAIQADFLFTRKD